jgi:hypothetical protein
VSKKTLCLLCGGSGAFNSEFCQRCKSTGVAPVFPSKVHAWIEELILEAKDTLALAGYVIATGLDPLYSGQPESVDTLIGCRVYAKNEEGEREFEDVKYPTAWLAREKKERKEASGCREGARRWHAPTAIKTSESCGRCGVHRAVAECLRCEELLCPRCVEKLCTIRRAR